MVGLGMYDPEWLRMSNVIGLAAITRSSNRFEVYRQCHAEAGNSFDWGGVYWCITLEESLESRAANWRDCINLLV